MTDLHSPISTVARRIQRDAATRSPLIRTWYDAEGRPMIVHERDMISTVSGFYEGAALRLDGGRYTQRQVQDLLDAHVHAVAEGGDYWLARDSYLTGLEAERGRQS